MIKIGTRLISRINVSDQVTKDRVYIITKIMRDRIYILVDRGGTNYGSVEFFKRAFMVLEE